MGGQSRFTGLCLKRKEDNFIGWAINVVSPAELALISVWVDNQKLCEIRCDQDRPDIQEKINFFRSNIGFNFVIPEHFYDGKKHQLAFRFINGEPLFIIDSEQSAERVSYVDFQLSEKKSKVEYISYIDGWLNGSITGWVLKKDLLTGQYIGNCQVLILMNGVELKTVFANKYRGDVSKTFETDARCGFSVFVPFELRKSVKAEFRIFAIPERVELRGSPYNTTLIDDLLEQQLVLLNKQADLLHQEIENLQSQLKKLIAYPEYNLDEYTVWSKKYFAYLPEKLEILKNKVLEKKHKIEIPLISVICPVYEPELHFFKIAVESILSQTYDNWELILINDGSKSCAVQKEIDYFTKLDSRIKSVVLKKNQGISAATNAGLKKAIGKWIAFFDHDDVLVPQALEMMIMSAQLHQVPVIYSDEDILSIEETYIAPNLKPDFNYRYLLGCNYICHFVMARIDVVEKVGRFNSKYDGAQDHDFLLRLTEVIPTSQIYHLSEILYHWRQTRNSTAEAIHNKQYAVKAGIACVQDHLRRIGKTAKVSAYKDMSIYQVIWDQEVRKSVTIIIPFRDQMKMTKQCVDSILEKTSYKDYKILLINNQSVELETLSFIKVYKRKKNIEVLEINEAFNFSRLNNLAVAYVKSEFYLFLNNDVIIEDKNWLTMMVNEAALFDDVAVVGARLLYPNGKIQHNGVIVGAQNVGYHIGHGLEHKELGYCFRFVLSQELSAVTAAMMLVRASVFHEVGGFDEVNLRVAYNDVDFCLKVREAGYRIVLTTNVVAVHHESFSRGSDDDPRHLKRFTGEMEYMNKKWGNKQIYQHDPAYSPYFCLKHPLFYELKDPEKIQDIEL